MRHSTLLGFLTALAVLAPAAHADRFYVGDPKRDQADGQAEFVHGVLLREQEGQYVIRVVGGEMWLDKARVHRIEKDDLTIARVEQLEREEAEKVAAANERRLAVQAAQAEARQRLRAEAAAAEASAQREIEARADEMTIAVDFDTLVPRFQPSKEVLRRLDLVKLSREIEDYLRANGYAPDDGRATRDFTVHVDFAGALPAYGFQVYDPIIHRVDLQGLARQVEDFLRAELARAANRPQPRGAIGTGPNRPVDKID